MEIPHGALAALLSSSGWWVPMCMYDDVQRLPATGAFFLPASGAEFIAGHNMSAVYVFEVDQHAHEFLDAFHEAHKDHPKLQATWKFMKVAELRPAQVFNALLRHGLVPVQVRRDWAPAMFKIYREGHHGVSGSRHGQALQFAVDKALEDYARIERERSLFHG